MTTNKENPMMPTVVCRFGPSVSSLIEEECALELKLKINKHTVLFSQRRVELLIH
jgi:hypothetical protein